MKSAFAKNMIRARKVWGFTQEAAAEKIGIARTTLTAYEEGKHQPKFDVLGRIVSTYKIKDILDFITNPHYFEQ